MGVSRGAWGESDDPLGLNQLAAGRFIGTFSGCHVISHQLAQYGRTQAADSFVLDALSALTSTGSIYCDIGWRK